jgi:uncharacterized RDD family membrane protein YckC
MTGVSNGKRFLAFLLDLAVVEFIITRPLSKLVNESFSRELSFASLSDLVGSSSKLLFVALIMGLLGVMYWAVLEYKIGQTLGGLLFKIRARGESGKLSFSKAVLRNLSKLSVMLLIIDSLNIFFNDKKQRFLEVWSKSVTVEGR